MKKHLFVFFLIGLAWSASAQDLPFLRVDVRQNLLTQKIDILDGPRPLSKNEVITILQTNPESLAIYEKAMRKQQINTALAVVDLGLLVGTTVLIFTPQQQSSTLSNLFWPIAIGTAAVGIVSGVFRREARNLTRDAIDTYNFGNKNFSPPVYFEENRMDQPIFSVKIPFR
ncbi:hypothetical protein [Algoriphagus sp. AK58]|uniref:hypothetical protein n=1 Tax=Algoriphagus sp. AK58 TaxID=1406877 RepID=UPI00164FB7F2|nr:hypothetical protein [Algoriphagus sp. AK58]MBC6366382.1 hypothetical protein [Algoriphagus sp. AK58]